MEHGLPTSPHKLSPWRPALLLILGVTVARLAYLAWFCPYALVEDEAYYWLWSRHLDWSYLTKGPGIALTIAAGAALAGDSELGIRLTAPLWGAILGLGIAGLAGDLTGNNPSARRRARLWGAGAALLCPPLQATSLLMTIDGPMLACWAIASWSALRALHARSRPAWLSAGAAIGVGILFKPTIAVLVLGLAAHAATSRRVLNPTAHWPRWLLISAVLALAGLAPIVAWNASHAWPLASHLGEHLRTSDTAPDVLQRATWLGEYLGIQLALAGPALIGAALALHASRRTPESTLARPLILLCLWTAAPVYLLYLAVSVFTRVEGNWALGGLIPLVALTAAWLGSSSPTASRHLVRAILGIGLLTGLGMLRLDLLARIPVLGPLVPVGRLTGGPTLARGTHARLSDLKADNTPAPFIITDHYGRAALLEFYLNAHAARPSPTPTRIACASAVFGGRLTHFDLWPEFSLQDPTLRGRSALLLGGRREAWATLFGRVEPVEPIREDHKARQAFRGWTYRGLPASEAQEREGDGS